MTTKVVTKAPIIFHQRLFERRHRRHERFDANMRQWAQQAIDDLACLRQHRAGVDDVRGTKVTRDDLVAPRKSLP